MKNPGLTIIIPTYNESGIIVQALGRIETAIGGLKSDAEILIADDGQDDLPQAVEKSKLSLGFASVVVMRNPMRLGKGASIRKAVAGALGDVIGFIDADLSVDPKHIPEAVSAIRSGCDICIGSRVGDRWKSDKSLATSIIASIFRFCHSALLFGPGNGFSDTQCGFKFFRGVVAKDLYGDLVASDGLADLEVLLKARRNGYKISEIKVPRNNERVSKRKISRIFVSETLSFFRIVARYRLGI